MQLPDFDEFSMRKWDKSAACLPLFNPRVGRKNSPTAYVTNTLNCDCNINGGFLKMWDASPNITDISMRKWDISAVFISFPNPKVGQNNSPTANVTNTLNCLI
jgi:hypothetical protein